MQRTTKWVAAALAAGVVVVIAGGVGAGPASSQSGPVSSQSGDDDELTGPTRDQAVAAALKATGGGTVTDTEMGDDGAAYGVEVLSGGREVEVNMDRNLSVIGREADNDSGDDDELTGAIRDRVIAAALKATGGGTVTDTETGDDGAAYGVEIRLADGREVEVNLDRNLNVIGQEVDD